jgi:hypothetical protein
LITKERRASYFDICIPRRLLFINSAQKQSTPRHQLSYCCLSHQLHHPSKTPINIVFIIARSTLPFSKRSTIKGRINHYPTPVCLLAAQSKTNSLLDTRIWVYREENRHLAVPASPLEAIKNEICGIRCRCRDIIKALVVAASNG